MHTLAVGLRDRSPHCVANTRCRRTALVRGPVFRTIGTIGRYAHGMEQKR
jgi:hypothetical protein